MGLTTMSSQTYKQKIQSLQHSVLFLQQEHTNTLNGLHKEISKLQAKCSELTFQLVQCGTSPKNITVTHNGSPLQQITENEIRELRLENQNCKSLLESKDKKVLLLEGQLKSREQKHADDIKNVQKKIHELQLDIEQKSNNIKYLTTQLRQTKNRNNEETFAADVTTVGSVTILNPSPPRSSPPQRSRYSLRRTAPSPSASVAAANLSGLIQEKSSHQLIARDEVLEKSLPKLNSKRSRFKQSITDPARPSVGYSHSRREKELKLASNIRPKPNDYEDFITLSKSNEVITKSSIEPLPPITTRSGRQLRDTTMKARTRLRNKPTANSKGEVETLCIESQLTSSPDKIYRELPNSSTK